MSTPEQMAGAEQLAHECIDLAAATGNACFANERTELRGLAAMMIARGAQSVASANLLARNGLVGDAMACGRTMVELAIDFRYIALDPAARIRRFAAHNDVHEHRMATAVAVHGGIVPGDFLEELRRLRDAFAENNPGTLANWAGRTIADRAEDGDRDALYDLSYRDQCNASHSGPGTLEYALVDPHGERRVRFGPMTPEAHPIILAVSGMLVLIGDTVDSCSLDPALGHRSEALTDRMRPFAGQHPLRRT